MGAWPAGTHVEAASGAAVEAQGSAEQHPGRALIVPGPEPGIAAGRAVREQPRAGQGCPHRQHGRQHRQHRPHPDSGHGSTEREKRSGAAEPSGAARTGRGDPGPAGRDGE